MSEANLIYDGAPVLLPMQGRSDGIHISTIIKELCIRLGHFKERDEGPIQAQLELGNALEWAIIQRYILEDPDRYMAPGELELDDLFGTPDVADVEDLAIEEIKLTWMSSRHEIDSDKFWRYWVQLMAYCKMMGWTLGRLHICHVNGDYTYDNGSGPVYRVWERRFTKAELNENWAMLLIHAESMRSRQVLETRPPKKGRR